MEQEIQTRLKAQQYREAFELLVGQFQARVHRLAWSMLRDRALAEDTTQEIFVRIWKALPRYGGRSSLSTWIYAIARNACLSALQARARERAAATCRFPPDAARFGGEEMPAHARWDVQAVMAHLPEHYRRALVLYYLEGRSYKELGEMLGMPLGTVKTCLHRAKKQMARAMMAAGSPQKTAGEESHAMCTL